MLHIDEAGWRPTAIRCMACLNKRTPSTMHQLPSRFRRLDEILGDLPVEEPMLLSELDGYLTAIALCPAPITPAEWLPPIWGGIEGEAAPFDDPIDVQLFADMVGARHAEILRELDRNKPKPLFDVDERSGETLWEGWIDGFAMATRLRPEGWVYEDPAAADALSQLHLLADIAVEASDLTSMEINDLTDEAPLAIVEHVVRLHACRAATVGTEPALIAKVGRNAPCLCGSGKKHKRCCGA